MLGAEAGSSQSENIDLRMQDAINERSDVQAPTFSIVIPVFEEGTHLPHVIGQVCRYAAMTGDPYELILVDDGSSDDTWRIIAERAALHPALRALRLSRNFGKEAAVCAGLDAARGMCVVVMDGDLQHPPELLPQMVAMWKSGSPDVVEAIKDDRGRESMVHRVGARLFYVILNALTRQDLRNASDFKLVDRRVLDAWRRMGEHSLFFRGMVAWLGFDRVQIRFRVADRIGGKSAWTFVRLMKLAVTGVTAFSSSPLQIVTFLGTAFFLFAIVLGGQTLYNWLSGTAVSGFTTVILLILIVGALQMICLGILGAYLARVYEEVKARPRYVVKERMK
jgi:glycosyltransferase involved in cell wall biosynthesis